MVAQMPDARRRDSKPTGRKLSKILRHTAVKDRIDIRSDGFVRLTDLLAKAKIAPSSSVEDIVKIVKTDEKLRFGLGLLADPPRLDSSNEVQVNLFTVEDFEAMTPTQQRAVRERLYVRAHQGFSITTVRPERVYERVLRAADIPVCIHGTKRESYRTIMTAGLKPMKRTMIHFGTRLQADPIVMGRIRKDAQVAIYIDVARAMADGIQFWKARNGVILSPGRDGCISRQYFERAVDLSTGRQIPLEPDYFLGQVQHEAATPITVERITSTVSSLSDSSGGA